MSFLFGRKPRYKQVSTLTPGQQRILGQLQGNLGGAGGAGYNEAIQYLRNLISGEPGAFQAFEAPARRAFEEQTIPQILERFSGAGAGRSSGLNQTLARGAERLEEGLAGQRANLQQGAVQSLLNQFLSQSQLGLGTRAFENIYEPGSPGFLQSLLGGIAPGLGSFGQSYGQSLGQNFGLRNLINFLTQQGMI